MAYEKKEYHKYLILINKDNSEKLFIPLTDGKKQIYQIDEIKEFPRLIR